jgi:hypothetical protein
MISVIAFLCALSISPAECNRASAIDVVTFPESVNELTCMLDAQTTLASLAVRADEEHYWKVLCTHSNRGMAAVG